MLTKKQKNVYDYIKSYTQKRGYAPSLEEIRRHARVAYPSTAQHYIKKLQEAGYLHRDEHRPRGIDLSDKRTLTQILMLGTIAAGEPIEAIRTPIPVDIPQDMISDVGRYYALKVRGDSMIEEGIFDGDVVIVREQQTVEPGETAVVYLPDKDEATLKKVYPEKNRIRLQPANKKLKAFYEYNVAIQGKVVGVLRMVD